jgi:hypothetical protein
MARNVANQEPNQNWVNQLQNTAINSSGLLMASAPQGAMTYTSANLGI